MRCSSPYILQSASGRSSALPSLAVFLVLSLILGKLHLHSLFFRPQIQKLCFQQTKEILCTGIVKTVSLAGHTLYDAMFLKSFTVAVVLILPTLIGMQYQTVKTIKAGKSLVKHIIHLLKYVSRSLSSILYSVYYYASSGYKYDEFTLKPRKGRSCGSYELLSLPLFSTH